MCASLPSPSSFQSSTLTYMLLNLAQLQSNTDGFVLICVRSPVLFCVVVCIAMYSVFKQFSAYFEQHVDQCGSFIIEANISPRGVRLCYINLINYCH